MKWIALILLLLVSCKEQPNEPVPEIRQPKIEITKIEYYKAVFSDGMTRHMYLGRVKNSGTLDGEPVKPRILVWRGTGRDTTGIPDEITYGWLGKQHAQLWSGVVNATDRLRAGEELDFNVSTRAYPTPLLKIKFEMYYGTSQLDPAFKQAREVL